VILRQIPITTHRFVSAPAFSASQEDPPPVGRKRCSRSGKQA